MVELKGLHVVKAKGRVYYYAWRGGPRVHGTPGTPQFQAAYNAAVAEHRLPETDRFRSLVTQYKASADYQKLAATTKRNWSRWLDRIADHFGELRIAQFDRSEKIRPLIRRWRNTYADTPRNADYGMQVLSRVCAYAVDPLGRLASNPCEGLKRLYTSDRSEIIWTDSDIGQLKATCSAEIALAVDLAAHTGLRMGDLVRLSWSHIGEDAITISTGKSRHKREAMIPLYDELRAILARIPRRSPVVLTSSKSRPWTVNGLGSSFNKAKIDAGLADEDLHFHDLRGTAVTKFYLAGLSERVIAEMMAWEEETVSRIIRRYVSRKAAIRATITKLNSATPKGPEDPFIIADGVKAHALDAQARGGGVYFIRAPKSGRVKIGQAASPLSRMLELCTGASEQLTLAAVVPGDRSTEAYLHEKFAAWRAKGEWFDENPLLADLIALVSTDPLHDWKAWLGVRASANIIHLERE